MTKGNKKQAGKGASVSGLASLLAVNYVSGVSALLYQIIWIRQVGDTVGNTVYAMSTVLAIYFAGLAMGGYLFGRRSLGARSLSRLYVALELGTAFLGLLTLIFFIHDARIFRSLSPFFGEKPHLFFFVQCIFLSLVMLPPAICIGGTLPVINPLISARASCRTSVVSITYAVNVAGAVCGALMTGLFLIPSFGIIATTCVGTALNMAAAAMMWHASKSPDLLDSPEAIDRSDRKLHEYSRVIRKSYNPRLMLAVFCLLGFAAMSLEIIWARYLTLILHSTVYVSTFAIASVLIGMSCGSFVSYYPINRPRVIPSLFVFLCFFCGLYVFLSLNQSAEAWHRYFDTTSSWKTIALLGHLVIPPSLCFGMLFPLGVEIITSHVHTIGATVGKIGAWNTLGGILGSLLTGFLVLPLLGIQQSINLILILYAIIAVTAVALFLMFSHARIKALVATVFMIILIAAALVFFQKRLPYTLLSSPESIVHVQEGLQSNLVVRSQGDGYLLEIDRLWQGETRQTRQIIAAHLPMAIRPQAEKVCVIGVGAGQTMNSFALYPVRRIDGVDIESSLRPLLERYFPRDWLRDPRVTMYSDDGKKFVQLAHETYDIISVEIGQTYRPNLGGFYHKEFYENCRRILTPTGIVSQFVPITCFDAKEFVDIIATFQSVFPHSSMWYNTEEFLLIGSSDPSVTVDGGFQSLRERNPRAFAELSSFSYWGDPGTNLGNYPVLAASFLFNDSRLDAIARRGRILHDDRPVLEYRSARVQASWGFLPFIEKNLTPLKEEFPSLADAPEDIQGLERIRSLNLHNIVANGLLVSYLKLGQPQLLRDALLENPSNVAVLMAMGESYMASNEMGKARASFENVLRIDDRLALAMTYASWCSISERDWNSALRFAERAQSIDSTSEENHNMLGIIYDAQGRFDDARRHFERALALNPSSVKARSNLEKFRKSHGK